MLPINFNPRKTPDYIFHILLPILAVGLPLVLLSLDVPTIPLITTTIERLFTTFGFCMWCVLLSVAYREIKTRQVTSLETGIVALLPLLVSFFLLILIVEDAEKSWDYNNYENAIRAVILRTNPYDSPHYLYPPLFAQLMAGVYSIGKKLLDPAKIDLWLFVFYIHQCIQFFLANLAYQFSSRLASRLGYSNLQNKLIVTGLFLFNFPLIRTLHLEQINLIILNAILIALLALNRFPFLSGAAVMFGGLIKLYPFIMGVPLLLMKKWKALLGAIASGVIIILFQTNFGRDLLLWKQFFRFLVSFPTDRESSTFIRNTTPLSLAHDLSRFVGFPESLVLPFYIISILLALTWIGLRFYRREQTYVTLPPGQTAETYRNFGNLLDFASLALLITPSAWDHHFIIALPLALWAIAIRGKEEPGWVGVAIVCIFALPPLDIFPFSFLRMFGLIALLILTPPNILLKSFE